MQPMLATRGDVVPTGPEWTHEVKWDGMRVLAVYDGDSARLLSRNNNDVSASFPEVRAALEAALGDQTTMLDGEIVALVDGAPSFGALAERMHQRNPRRVSTLASSTPVHLFVFDVVRAAGLDVTNRPWRERRAILEELHLGDDVLVVPPVYDDGGMLLEATAAQGLEGVVSKRVDSPYRPGVRSRDWLKFAHRTRRSVVVGGWRAESGARAGSTRLGAVLVGEPTSEGLYFLGRVGSGLGGRLGAVLSQRLQDLTQAGSPFEDEVPRRDAEGVTWVRPEIVLDVESLGLSSQGRLRQPAVKSIRDDLRADELTAES